MKEFYQVYEDLPKDLMKFKKLLLREKYKAFIAYSGMLSHYNTMKLGEEIFEVELINPAGG